MGINSFYYTGISHGNWAGWYLALKPAGTAAGICLRQWHRPVLRPPTPGRRSPPRPELDLDRVVGNREALEKMAWMENWPTNNPDRLRRRAGNHKEHLQILLNRKREEFTVRNTNMSCCDAKTREEFYETMAKISVPVLFLHGMLDPLAKIEDVVRLSQAIPALPDQGLPEPRSWGRGRVPGDLRPGLRPVLPGYRGQGFVKLQNFSPCLFLRFPWYNKKKTNRKAE